MLDRNDMNFDPDFDPVQQNDPMNEIPPLPETPAPSPVDQVFSQLNREHQARQAQQAQNRQQAGGSYYSPRSGYPSGGSGGYPNGGGYVPPVNNNPPESGSDNGQPKKSRVGLKIAAIAASIAIVAGVGFGGYKLIKENRELRAGQGSTASVAEQTREKKTTSEASSESAADSQSSNADSAAAGENMGFIELASRENAMSIPDIVDKVTPATVGVSSTFLYTGSRQSYSMWGWGFGTPQTATQEVTGTGTGIVMSDNNNGSYYVLTNAHVIYDSEKETMMGLAKSVKVVLNEDYYDGDTEFAAEVVGYDVAEDIAVLKITTSQKLTVAEFGSSDDLRVGELVVAIGNPLGFELFGSVTTGIVSALDRQVTINDSTMRLIQTDTAINAGNSGGPLINSYGQVIGINSAKLSNSYYSSGEASIEGLCFAIPISHAKDIINDLINFGYITGKPMMGINLTVDIDESISQRLGIPVGVYIRDLEAGGAAELAGMQPGDVIIAVGGKTITNYEELKAEKDNYKAGETMTVTATRNGVDMDFQLVLQEQTPTAAG